MNRVQLCLHGVHTGSELCGRLQEGLLYWCDARTDKIERINLETGENRELVLANNNMDMFAVSVFEEFIYWSDRSTFNLRSGTSVYRPLD